MTSRPLNRLFLLTRLLLLVLTAGATLASQSGDEVVRLPGEAGVNSDVAARLAYRAAAADRYEVESFAQEATALLDALLAVWSEAGEPDARAVRALCAFSDDARAEPAPTRWGEPVVADGHGEARVRVRILLDGTLDPGTPAAFGLLLERLAEAAGGEISGLRLKNVAARALEDGQIGLGYLLRVVSTDAAGTRSLDMEWSTVWSRDADGAARLHGWSIQLANESQASARARFHDVTGSVLTGPAAALLGSSFEALRRRLDAAVGIGFLGHHGVAVGDLNGDGIEDLLFSQPGGLADQLWLRGADGRAREAAAEAGLDHLDPTTSMLIFDADGDGDQDVLKAHADAVVLYVHTGKQFEEVWAYPMSGATSMAAADVDGDALVDVYVCGYASPYEGGTLPAPYHDANNGQQNILLRNVTLAPDAPAFEDATRAFGLEVNGTRFSFAAAFEDFDDDGDQDLYVANDFGRNNLYRNEGGRFLDVAAAYFAEDMAAGMGVAWHDADGDTRPDLYVSNMFSAAGRRLVYQRDYDLATRFSEGSGFQALAEGNSLLVNRGARGFAYAGTTLTFSPRNGLWAWGAIPIDLDGDGREDLYVPNGFVTGEDPEDL